MRRFLCLAVAVALAIPAAWANDASPVELIRNGHYKRARAAAEQRLRTNPNDAEAHYALARYREASGDLDGAESLAEKACKLDPKNGDYRYLLAGIHGQKAEKASIFGKPGLAKKFKTGAEEAVQLDPKNIEARVGLIQFHLQAPGIMGGDKAKARLLADEIAKIDAGRGYLAMINIARREKREGEIPGLYQKIADSNPKSYGTLLNLAGYYGSDAQKKYDLSEKFALEAQKLTPDRVGAYNQLAGFYAFQKKWKELEALLALAEKNVPDNFTPHYQAGRVLMQNNTELPRAEQYLRKYLTQEPEPGAPSHAHAWWRLGNTFEKQGRKPESIQALEIALRLKPDLEEAKKDLKRLK